MYCREKVEERLSAAQELLGWRPVYHSIEEVDKVKERLEEISTYNDAGEFVEYTRPFTEEEKWWIRNERTLCACDAEYFLTRYAYLKDDSNQIIKFKFRTPQKVYFNVIAALEKRGSAIQLIILKGRQLGCSTLTELLVAHRVIFYYGINAVIASSNQQSTQIMSQMTFLAYDMLPPWMKPKWKSRVEGERGNLTLTTKSGISFQHGKQTSGIARGHTPTLVHLSECSSFPNPEELIDASLFRAVHESPNVFMVLESTAEGVDNWWHRTWKTSKAGWDKGRSRLCPMFLPWYIGKEMYPKPTWLATRPVPEGWVPNEETKQRMAKAKMFVANSGILSEVLGKDWEMGIEQAWFSEVDYEEYKDKGREKLWKQEMAGDDIECFQGSYDSVFKNDRLLELNDRRGDYKVYGIKGNGIEDRHMPYDEEIDYDGMRDGRSLPKSVRYESNDGTNYSWQFIPIRRDLIDDSDPENMDEAAYYADGKLLVFKEPEEGYDYTIGVDTGYGKGADSTCIEVWRKGERGMPDVQVAEFAGAYIHHVEAFAFAMPIAAYYAKYMRHTHLREPLVSIEVLAAIGDTCQINMRKMGYSRFHHFVRYDQKKVQKKKATKIGWMTTGWSRPMLVDGFVNCVHNDWVVINSPFLLREMANFEVHSTSTGKQKLEHASGSHDDRIFGSAIAIFTSHDLEKMVDRGKNRPVLPTSNYKPQLNLAPVDGYKISHDSSSISASSGSFKSINDLEDFINNERFSR